MSARRRRSGRARGTTLFETTLACGFAVIVLGIVGTETLRQRLELSSARGEARARSALLSVYERLRAGVLPPPAAGAVLSAADEPGLKVTVERAALPAGSRIASAPGVAPVVVRATWRDFDGKTRSRQVTTLVADVATPGAQGGNQ